MHTNSPLALLTFALFLFTVSSASSNDLEIGIRDPKFDRLWTKEPVVKKKIPVLPVTVEETRTFTVPGNYVITQIRALDQKGNGHGAHAVLVAGGPNSSFVTLEFKSQRGHSIDFLVEVYAKLK